MASRYRRHHFAVACIYLRYYFKRSPLRSDSHRSVNYKLIFRGDEAKMRAIRCGYRLYWLAIMSSYLSHIIYRRLAYKRRAQVALIMGPMQTDIGNVLTVAIRHRRLHDIFTPHFAVQNWGRILWVDVNLAWHIHGWEAVSRRHYSNASLHSYHFASLRYTKITSAYK